MLGSISFLLMLYLQGDLEMAKWQKAPAAPIQYTLSGALASLRTLALRASLPLLGCTVVLAAAVKVNNAWQPHDTSAAEGVWFCAVSISCILAVLSAAPREGETPSVLIPYLYLVCVIPAVEVYSLMGRLSNVAADDPQLMSLGVSIAAHGLHFLFLAGGIALLERAELPLLWRGLRGYFVLLGVNNFCASLYIRSIGGSLFPAPGGTATFGVSVLFSSVALLVAAVTTPGTRRIVLDMWTSVPLSALSTSIQSESTRWHILPVPHLSATPPRDSMRTKCAAYGCDDQTASEETRTDRSCETACSDRSFRTGSSDAVSFHSADSVGWVTEACLDDVEQYLEAESTQVEQLRTEGGRGEASSGSPPLVLLQRVGAGRFTSVWQARWGRHLVAVKSLNRSTARSLRAFEQEIHLLRQLRHRNICAFYGTCKLSGDMAQEALLLEYMDSGSLQEFIFGKGASERPTPPPARLQMRIAVHIAAGLAYLHQCGCAHRNVTCGNVLLKWSRKIQKTQLVAKLADFGLARICGTETSGYDSSEQPDTCESIRYWAPERLDLPTSGGALSVDTYSFAILLFELTHQKVYFESTRAGFAVVYEAKAGRRPELNLSSESLRALLTRCWDGSPEVRPPMPEVAAQLRSISRRSTGKTRGCLGSAETHLTCVSEGEED